MRNILTMALKDLRILSRDKFGLFWLAVFPLVYALFFGAIFSGQGGETARLPIAIVDLDQTDGSREFIAQIESSSAIALATLKDGEGWTEDTARDRVRKGAVVAAVVIPDGYGDAQNNLFSATPPAIRVDIDPSRTAEAGILQGILTEAAFSRFSDMFTNPASMTSSIDNALEQISDDENANPVQKALLSTFLNSARNFSTQFQPESYIEGDTEADEDDAPDFNPVAIEFNELAMNDENEISNAYEISFPSAMIWGLIGCASGFAIGLVKEHKDGTMTRLRVAPHSRAHILASKGLGCFIACCAVILMLMLFGALIFGVRILNPLHLAMAVVSASACFVGMMLMVSTFGTTEEGVAGAGWAMFMACAMLGGGMVPLIAMPSWMLTASSASPVKWAIVALEGAIWRNYTTPEMLLPCAILLAVGAVCFTIGLTVLSRRA